MQTLMQDLRYAARMLRRNWALTLVIVASLAIGIGANTAVFSVVNALLLKPLPYPDPDRLVILWLRSPGINIPQDWPSPGQYIDVRTENRSFEEMSISQGTTGTLVGLEQPERVEALRTSSSLFHLLGAQPLYGRLLLPEDDVPGKAPVVVLSHAFWKRMFGADPNMVGRSISLNGLAPRKDGNQFTVVGVLRPEFLLNEEIMPTVASIRQMDLFMPLPLGADAVTRRGDENYNLMARLKPGVSAEQAQADISVIAARIRDKDKRDRTFTISVVPLLEQVVGNVRRAVLVLLGSVALVLLIACANVANLLLTRASGRQKEVAIRTALGAGWLRLVRQLLTESLILGLMGGLAGLLIARLSLYVVHTVNPGNIPRLEVIGLDGGVLTFTLAVSILTGIIFGLAPAIRAARVDLNTALKAGGRSVQSDGGFNSSRRRLRSVLVVSELALSLMLLIGAGLLVRSFVRLQSVAPGFNPGNVISMRIGRTGMDLSNQDTAIEYFRQVGDRLARIPGITARGAVTALPFTSSVGWGSVHVEGWIPQPGQELQVDQRAATPDYFRTMEIPLIKGRFFNDFDALPNAQPVAIIDEKFAQRFWPGENPIGKHLWNDPKRQMTIVGVVGTVKQYRSRRRRPHRLLSPVARSVGLSGGADGSRSRRRRERHGPRDSRSRPDDSRVRHQNDGRSTEGLAGQAALRDDHARFVLRVRDDSGDRGGLRRHVASGDAGHARHRRAHGSRRAAEPHRLHGDSSGNGADRRRRRARPRGRRADDARHGKPAVRRQRNRSCDVRVGAADPRRHRAGGELRSGASCHARRSGHCAAG